VKDFTVNEDSVFSLADAKSAPVELNGLTIEIHLIAEWWMNP